MLVENDRLLEFLKGIQLFGKLDDEQLALIIESIKTRLIPAGVEIYELGSEAVNFYVVYSGKVSIHRSIEGTPDFQSNLIATDTFGSEALFSAQPRQTSAAAVTDSILLEIDGDELRDLERSIPDLGLRISLLRKSFGLLWDVPLSWREEDETIYYVARRHVVFVLIRLIGPLLSVLTGLLVFLVAEVALGAVLTPALIAGLLISLGVAWGIWNYIDWTNDYYIITDRRLIYLERIIFLYDSRTEAPMEAILSVNQRTGLIGRWFGFGDVTVKSFTGTVVFADIEAPQEVQNMIERYLLRARSRRTQEERKIINRTISNRLGRPAAKPQAGAPENKPAEAEMRPGALQKFLANFFHMRYEENGVITYRKHWYILLLHIWAPTLILIGLLALFVARLFNAFTVISLLAVFALVTVLGIVVTLWWLYQYVDWSNDIYVITSDQVIDVYKRPLGTEVRKAAPLKNILSIEYQRIGFIGYILNYGTVFIKVGESTFDFDYVYNPSDVQRELFKRFSEYKYREKLAQDEADAKRMADWIEGYHEWAESNRPPTRDEPPPTNPGSPFPRQQV